MKKYYLLLLFQFVIIVLHAQNTAPSSSALAENKRLIDGLTVVIKEKAKDKYLFAIDQGSTTVFNPDKPVTVLPRGFKRKEDAFKVAEWMIKDYKLRGFWPSAVPPTVLKQLNISQDQISQN